MNCSEYLNQVKIFLDNANTDFNQAEEFAISQDGIIFNNYETMKNENKNVAKYINDYFPEECDKYEYGEDINQYKEKIRKIYNKAVSLLRK